jgi:hypothetical protein
MTSGRDRAFRYFFFLAILGCVLAACGGGGVGGGTRSNTIGSEGGTVSSSDPSGLISLARVYIPQGALAAEEAISLKAVSLPKALPAGYQAAGPCVSFSPDGITFAQKASLYLPYSDANNDGYVDGKGVPESKVGVLYYNQGTGTWEVMPVQGRDGKGNLVVAQTGHFSTYLAVIDTGDSTPLDPGTSTGTDALESGDCLVGTANIQDPYGDSDACFYYNMTITRRESSLYAIVDRFATYVEAGFPATVSPDGLSATFDAASTFTRVRESGDARLWNWEAEFVKEHTHLKDYEVLDDVLTGVSGTGVYASIEAVDANMVKISWGINLNEQLVFVTSSSGGGHSLVVRFRASYL